MKGYLTQLWGTEPSTKGEALKLTPKTMSGNQCSEKLNGEKVFQAERTIKQKPVGKKAGQRSWGTEHCKQGQVFYFTFILKIVVSYDLASQDNDLRQWVPLG